MFYYIMVSKIKLTFPIANNPLSKIKRIPKNRNATPKPANPTPISKSK